MITMQEEQFTDAVIDQMENLIMFHGAEVEDLDKADPDWGRYRQMNDIGIIRLYTARDEKKLIGYIVYMVGFHMHHKGLFYAIQDALYVRPDYRVANTARNLLIFSEFKLRELNVMVIMQYVKVEHDFSIVLERMGYRLTEKVLTKHLVH